MAEVPLRSDAGSSELHVKSPGPTKTHWRMTAITVPTPQYRPRAAGSVTTKKYPNMIGKIHCICVFIAACWLPAGAAERELEMRCCIHIAANTATPRGSVPFSERSMPRKLVLSGMACLMYSTS